MKAKAPAKPSRRRPVELLLSPVDNNRLANLCGVLDENLRQIETALDVTIARRGSASRSTARPRPRDVAARPCSISMASPKQGLSVDEIQLSLIELLNQPVRRVWWPMAGRRRRWSRARPNCMAARRARSNT